MSKFLWGEICETTYIINRSPHRALGGKSPYSKLYSRNLDLSSLRIIGARAFVQKETHVHKLEHKAWEGLMIGIYNPPTRKITESRNVTFIETLPKALPPIGQEKILETNEKTLQEEDILGIYHYLVHQMEIKTQQRLPWHHQLHLTRGKVQLAQEVHQDHRDPIPRAHPVQQDHHPICPAVRPYQLGHPIFKGQRHNQLLH